MSFNEIFWIGIWARQMEEPVLYLLIGDVWAFLQFKAFRNDSWFPGIRRGAKHFVLNIKLIDDFCSTKLLIFPPTHIHLFAKWEIILKISSRWLWNCKIALTPFNSKAESETMECEFNSVFNLKSTVLCNSGDVRRTAHPPSTRPQLIYYPVILICFCLA